MARFAPRSFRGFDCARDCRGVPRDHHLPRRVEVHRLDDLPLRRLLAGGGKFRVVEPEDGRHRAFAERNRALHRLATEPDEVHRRAKIESLRTHERRVFAQAVSRHGHRHGSAMLQPHPPGGHSSGKHGGLSLFGGARVPIPAPAGTTTRGRSRERPRPRRRSAGPPAPPPRGPQASRRTGSPAPETRMPASWSFSLLTAAPPGRRIIAVLRPGAACAGATGPRARRPAAP